MEHLNLFLEFPVAIPFTGLFICLLLLLLSIIGIAIDSDVDHHFGSDSIFVTAGLSKVPLVIGMTFTFIPMTILTYFLNNLILKINIIESFFNSGTFGGIIYYSVVFISLFILFIISLFIAGFIIKPLHKIINIEEPPINYIGQQGIVNSYTLDQEKGEIKIFVKQQDCLLSATADEKLDYGQKIEIISIEDNKFKVKKVNK